MDHLRRLIDHLAWADRRVLDLLANVSPDPKVVELFAHVLGAEHIWLARLTAQPATVAVWPTLGLDQCARLAEENRRGLTTYLAALPPDRLGDGITYTNSAGQTFTSSVEDILLHVCLHGAYHRGQVMTILRAGGQATISADYIAYVRGLPPATRTAP
jgi:uncharacterized damage-inducible protein DinB